MWPQPAQSAPLLSPGVCFGDVSAAESVPEVSSWFLPWCDLSEMNSRSTWTLTSCHLHLCPIKSLWRSNFHTVTLVSLCLLSGWRHMHENTARCFESLSEKKRPDVTLRDTQPPASLWKHRSNQKCTYINYFSLYLFWRASVSQSVSQDFFLEMFPHGPNMTFHIHFEEIS